MAKKRLTAETISIERQALNQPMLQLRSNALLLYNQYLGDRKRNQTTFNKSHSFEQLTYTGEFTQSAKKSLSKAIEVINLINPKSYKIHPIFKKKFLHQLSFVTLTIPDDTIIHPSTAYQLLLRPFLQYLSKTHKLKSYIWKLEYQERGQIHYHITTDIVLHWKIIRDKWNYLIEKANLMQSYKAEYKNNNPPSSDIKKVYKIDNFVSYLQKEFIKSVQNNKKSNTWVPLSAAIEKYRVWDCSVNLKKNSLFKTEVTYNQEEWYKLLSTEDNNLATIRHYDNCSVVIPNGVKTTDLLTDDNKLKFRKYLDYIQNNTTIFNPIN